MAHSEAVRLKAVVQWMAHGNLSLVARDIDVPLTTLKNWKQQQWWKEYEDEVRSQAAKKTHGRLGKVVEKAIDEIEDRLENGDYVVTKHGIKRVKVKARDASQVMKDAVDRQVIMDKIANREHSREEDIMKRLEVLHEGFTRFIKAKEIDHGENQGVVPSLVVEDSTEKE